jgi:hypothetical protein
MGKSYLDYAGLQRLVDNINKKFAPIQAIVFKSTVETLAELPALNTVKAGWMYNAKVGGLTTDDFVEGAGHIVADGENIAAVELLTGVYTPVDSPAADADPKALGWYESDDDPTSPTYTLSNDRLPVAGKTYYTAGTEMKWDMMGGVFDLEDRYLEFGDVFPQTPPSRMVEGRTFLYMGADTRVYTKVATPKGRPNENGYFELTSATAVADPATIYNPKQQQLYEKNETDPSAVFYVLSNDPTAVDGKTYYTCTFVASEDTTVDATKIYYSEAVQFKKGGIYKYNAASKDWILQAGGGDSDMTPITNKEIDDLFI